MFPSRGTIVEKNEPLVRTPGARRVATSAPSPSEPATDVSELPSRTHDREVTTEHENENEGWDECGGD